MASTVITQRELEAHSTPEQCWIVIDGDVYDVTKFAMLHPGGTKILTDYAGKDCTEVFFGLHRHDVLKKYGPRLIKGRLETAEERTDENKIKDFSDISTVPYGEVMAWHGFKSPYWTEEHLKLRATLRKWLDENIRAEAEQGELSGKAPSKELFLKMGEVGIFPARLGPGKHWKIFQRLTGKTEFMGYPIDKYDYFAEAIVHEEFARLACPGFVDGLGSGFAIGMPPIIQFAHDEMREKVGEEVLMGKKRICLAITEPFAGSDVASIKTTAVKSADGTHFIVNGVKKWITNGHDSDYFSTLVKTDGGLTFLLIDRNQCKDSLETKKIKTSYSPAAGTALVIYEDCKVPVENVIGMENGGFLLSMYNFNHERWMIIALILAGMRGMIDECFKYAQQRDTFGKKLINHPVIRQKLAVMVAKTESCYSWFENLTFQMNNMPYDQQSAKLAGTMSLLKAHTTKMAWDISSEATQVFGGRGITQTGMGAYVERFMRTNKFAAILGGSEEIMADLGIKMAAKKMSETSKL